MAHEILSVKLCELDDKFGRMLSRIRLSESANPIRLKQEISALEKECAESELTLREKLKFSRAEFVSALSETYEKVEAIISAAEGNIQQRASAGGLPAAEEQTLLAEYALDFAMQAADRALLLSLQAIDAQMTQQER